jgi:hypothetical protein
MTEITSYENNGILFYVNQDGSECGISRTGLAKLTGISARSLGRLITVMGGGTADTKQEMPVSLIPCREMAVTLRRSSINNADVIPSKMCVAILKYYAFEQKNDVALYSCSKFMDIGIDSWIKDVVGFSNSDKSMALLESINATMGKLMVKVTRLEEIEEETAGYRKATVTMPLLEKWMNELTEEAKAKVLAPAEELFTIKEAVAIEFVGTVFSNTVYKKLALKVGQTIAALTDAPHKRKLTKNGKGYDQEVNAYTRAQLPLIKLCMMSILAGG